jgi:hypothetical protein
VRSLAKLNIFNLILITLIETKTIPSWHVLENSLVVSVALDEAANNQLFDANLDLGRVGVELLNQQLDRLLLQTCMVDRAPGLHYLDNRRLNFVDAEVLNLFLHAGTLLVLCLLAHHHRNLVAE